MTSHELFIREVGPSLTEAASLSDAQLIQVCGDALRDLMPLEGLGSTNPVERILFWMANQTKKLQAKAEPRARAVLQALEDESD